MTDQSAGNQVHHRPSLWQDRSFWGLNLTQFLGAFNDNLFKQLVLLICLDQARRKGGSDLQPLAMGLFAFPFVALSGYAGFLSDRYSKRTTIVLCKVAEVVIVVLGMIGFYLGSLPFLLAVLCSMGVHSAFFGPSKYGILPEMLRTDDLPRANGMILMATFLAIIFGLSAAGFAKQMFSSTLWLASIPCLVIAVMGLMSSLAIHQTPVAQPGMKFSFASVGVAPDTRKVLRADRKLLGVLNMSSVFWLIGGMIYPPAINSLCKEQFGLDDLLAGVLAASTGIGIAIGCVSAGFLSKDRFRGWIVRLGAWGMTLSLAMLALPGPGWQAVRDEMRQQKHLPASNLDVQVPAAKDVVSKSDSSVKAKTKADASAVKVDEDVNRKAIQHSKSRGSLLGPYGSAFALILVGVFAGLYSVPLQVFLQSNSPTEQKGRIIGVLNLMNWIGILGSAGIYHLGRVILVDSLMLPPATMFGFAALLMLMVAIFYRPPESPTSQQGLLAEKP